MKVTAKKINILVIVCVMLLIGCKPHINNMDYNSQILFPEDGTWYCKELQFTLRLEQNAISEIIVDGTPVSCVAGYYADSPSFYIMSGEVKDGVFVMEKYIFLLEYISSTKTELVLRDTENQTNYVFKKQ